MKTDKSVQGPTGPFSLKICIQPEYPVPFDHYACYIAKPNIRNFTDETGLYLKLVTSQKVISAPLILALPGYCHNPNSTSAST